LGLPLQQLFYSGDEDMESVKTVALTKVERLMLVNQFRSLQAANKDDEHMRHYYRRMEEIFERGYVRLYNEAFSDLSDEVSIEISEEVLAILDMHRALLRSLGEKPDPAYIEKVKFQGFDANNEGEYLPFAKFFQQHPDRPSYEELYIFNSHHPTLPRYRKMLAEWLRMGREPRLTRPQIDSILEAGTSKH
jgi:uncharacterized protein YfbU (UPF0304 family)